MRKKLTVAVAASLLAASVAWAGADHNTLPVYDWNNDNVINSLDLFIWETQKWRPGLPSWPLNPDGSMMTNPAQQCVICHY
ncbi:hypothetical protein [Corallococcus exiguus]|uniref:hypothetical protein n=1 Tax=Corallococcus exiguus TaxID=83462 RepID=UPI0011C47D82|nr:hypothetical protein [Corallococcus exiguus]NPC72301.1 hypothetical protein [Corallococcus exiguus]NPD26199.1 hypothetical protein [Corallococcus exiguus]NRD45669.1 hypothetical protein [Corallococcus exiguus]